jgi:hypothetical protein
LRHDQTEDGIGAGGADAQEKDVAEDRDRQDEQQEPADSRGAGSLPIARVPAEQGRAQLPGAESDFGAGWTI